MRRAEKNRELGIKSLQVQKYIQKPKVVSHCRHYIAGRCHEVFFTAYIYGTYHLYSCWFLFLWLVAQYIRQIVILVLILHLILI